MPSSRGCDLRPHTRVDVGHVLVESSNGERLSNKRCRTWRSPAACSAHGNGGWSSEEPYEPNEGWKMRER